MKKTLLLAGVACLFAANANAGISMYNQEFTPYIGADYVYDHASYKKDAKLLSLKKSYNSGMINVGLRAMRYVGLEAFFQQSMTNKTNKNTDYPVKSKFYAYGADLYGYLPIGCYGFNMLGSLGLADYNLDLKVKQAGKYDKQRMGYRMGLGMQYDFTNHFAARVMGRYNYIGAKHLDNLKEVTVGLRYSF